jgi:deoxycytidylate deaminase
MNNLKRYIEILKPIAEDMEPVSNARLSAMIVYKNRIISIGVNQKKTHPFAAKYSKNPDAIYLHAEAAAILSAKKKLTDAELKKSTLIICRVKYDRKFNTIFGIAKPCSGCEKCIEYYGIKTVIYTEDSDVGKMKYTTIMEN